MNGVKFLPRNVQEYDDMLRSIVVSHMGTGHGNPTQWVLDAMHDAWQRAFALGFDVGFKAASNPPAPPPAFSVQIPAEPVEKRRQLPHDVTDVWSPP